MKMPKFLIVATAVFWFSGCTVAQEKMNNNYYPVVGTKTAVVGLPLNRNGTPVESLSKLKVMVYPGGKVVFAGPEKFLIYFKNKKSPDGVLREASTNGVVVISIPNDIFERPEFSDEFKKNNSVTFNFGIVAGKGDIDPQIVVIRNK
jgi:hypothetical protein